MASCPTPNLFSYKAGAAIARGQPVKLGADKYHVVKAAANTDRCIGVAWGAADAAEDVLEVAHPGGGAFFLLGETCAAGVDVVGKADGSAEKPNAEGDQIIGRLLEGGAAGDLVPGEVYLATAHAAQ